MLIEWIKKAQKYVASPGFWNVNVDHLFMRDGKLYCHDISGKHPRALNGDTARRVFMTAAEIRDVTERWEITNVIIPNLHPRESP